MEKCQQAKDTKKVTILNKYTIYNKQHLQYFHCFNQVAFHLQMVNMTNQFEQDQQLSGKH